MGAAAHREGPWFRQRRRGLQTDFVVGIAPIRRPPLLVGLVLNATLGWSWADPLAGLVIAAVALKEGVEAWRGDACCAPVPGRLRQSFW